jgi:hypothetical protein
VLSERLHRLEISLHACAVIELVVVGVERAERGDEFVFARRLRTDGLGLLNGREALGQIAGGRHAERIEQQALPDTPIGDGAFGVGLEHFLENLFGGAVPERVLVAHAAIKATLRDLIA